MAISYTRPASEIAALRGNKVPFPHRIRMADGTSLLGEIHRSTTTRLADHLISLDGFLALTNVTFEGSGERRDYLLINVHHVVWLEEIQSDRGDEDLFNLLPNGEFALVGE